MTSAPQGESGASDSGPNFPEPHDVKGQIRLIRALQGSIHCFPLNSPEMKQFVDLCHSIAGRLTKTLLQRDIADLARQKFSPADQAGRSVEPPKVGREVV